MGSRKKKDAYERPVTIADTDNFLRRAYERFKASSDADDGIGVGSYHDAFTKLVLGVPQFAAEFFSRYIPGIDENYDCDRLQVLPTEIVGKTLTSRAADLIFLIPSKRADDPALALRIVLEHKAQNGSFEDAHTIAQTMYYVVSTTYDFVCKTKRVPMQPLGVVLYNGDRLDYGPLRWEERYPIDPNLAQYQIRCEFPVINVTECFAKGNVQGSKVLKAMLDALGAAGLGAIEEHIDDVVGSLSDLDWSLPFNQNFAHSLLIYYAHAMRKLNKTITFEQLDRLAQKGMPQNVRKKMKTLFDEEFDAGERKGRKEGMKVGTKKGKIEGKREEALALLADIFGSESIPLQKKIALVTDPKTLGTIFRLLYKFRNFDQLSAAVTELLAANPDATKPLAQC